MRLSLLVITLFLGTICVAALWWLWQDYQSTMVTPANIKSDEIFEIPQGASLQTVAGLLHERGIIQQPFYLVFEARRAGIAGRIRAGEYELQPGMSPRQLLEQFVRGEVRQHALTLVEGWTTRDVLEAVRNHPVLQTTLEVTNPDELMAAIGSPEKHPEGQFFPDTYHFPRGTTDVEFLQRAHKALLEVLAGEWEARAEDLPYQSSYEALIMASIIEKETGLASERDRIAGVFVRRLERGMRLQTDPTVIYAMQATYDGNIRKKDLQIDSPYNTYVNAGLPPTPIAIAGREAIHAALHPADGKALYFVARGDGSHHFSETLEEHNRAVAKYQLGKDQ